MEQKVRVNVDQTGVAHLLLSNPPLNALSDDLRRAIYTALEMAQSNPEVKAIVIGATGRNFSTGGAMTEFGSSDAPSLDQLCDQIEGSTKPVIAAIHGAALSAGAALALACHYRIAAKYSYVGFPEVNLGMVPEGGVTQRMPRILGSGPALELMLVGRTIAGSEAARLGLIDRIVPDHIGQESKAWARELAADSAPLVPTRERTEGFSDPKAYQTAIASARAQVIDRPVPAAAKIVECVEAAQLLPFEAGLAFEQDAAMACRESNAAKALRHLHLAEQRLSQNPGPDKDSDQIKTVAVLGAGAGAGGWAVVCLDAGMKVLLPDVATADDLRMRVSTVYNQAMMQNRLNEAQRADRLARLREAPLADADLVIDCTDEPLDDLIPQIPERAILAAVRAPGQEGEVLSAGGDPSRTVLIQTPGPIHKTRVIELLVGHQTSVLTRQRLAGFARALNRLIVPSPLDGGGIGAAVWGGCAYAADLMVHAGVAPEAIDAALKGSGFERVLYDTRTAPSAGAGSLDMPADQILQRLLDAMANTGALLIEGGLAMCPADVDVVMVDGFGFPRWLAGPMMTADTDGLLALRTRLRALDSEDPEFWAPSGVISELVKNGRRFADLNPR
ncbi:NAD-binding 3-hydroxyacyl-CoA dehydrogenase [Actibacterium atlanticum]|uniref:NAD-binding 3-hydroxyacyl-CoA dehydrogenase n=1 Tax=Actibacterium atlanticum TaxID=1461693 RepID=A0A058ZJD9_9RHOB|nr:enoyl-CoA hydratase-related protein [Actibacterium atlanticum]KCV81709.1 NAD-binding 3-hydroxyacyl-CoA dehydrogenase [Actibacterium atlanticum]